MKKLFALLLVCILALSTVLPATAADGKVTYSGNAGDFVFAPGSEHSLTDLFPDFKDVMPGDSITQKIVVKNDADNKVKVNVYLRALGAHEDSVEFLSQLGLRVQRSNENVIPYMFDAAADETAQLTDWILLGTLYSGGEVNLDVTLMVPVELDNTFQSQIGYLDWEFMVEEFPVETDDPKPPKPEGGTKPPDTGDHSHLGLWIALMIGSGAVLLVLIILGKRRKKKEETNTQS